MGKKEEGAEGKKRQHPLEGMQRALGLQLWSEGIMLGCRSISGLCNACRCQTPDHWSTTHPPPSSHGN